MKIEPFLMEINNLKTDRHRTVILPSGMRAEDYKNNPIVLADHIIAMNSIVGTSFDLKQTPSRVTVMIKLDEINEEASDQLIAIKRHYENDRKFSSSIGFRIFDYIHRDGYDTTPEKWQTAFDKWREDYRAVYGDYPTVLPDAIITDWELQEISIVAVGSNTEARQRSITGDKEFLKKFKENNDLVYRSIDIESLNKRAKGNENMDEMLTMLREMREAITNLENLGNEGSRSTDDVTAQIEELSTKLTSEIEAINARLDALEEKISDGSGGSGDGDDGDRSLDELLTRSLESDEKPHLDVNKFLDKLKVNDGRV